MTFIEWQWLFPVAVTLHNLEEAIWLPAWSQRSGKWHPTVSPVAFRFAVAVLTAIAFIVTIWSDISGPGSVGAYLLTGYVLAMLLNVPFPHIVVTLAMRHYMPGLATAIAINLPVTAFLLFRAFDEKYIIPKIFSYIGPLFCVAILAMIPVLFAIGRKWVLEPPKK